MRNLIYFFTKNAYVLYFLFLEFLAFLLIITYNNYQNVTFWNSTNRIVSNLNSSISSFNEYFHLKEENKDLLRQNAQLLNNKQQSLIKVFHENIWVNDTLYQQKFIYTPAAVVSMSTNKIKNFATLDVGELNGVKRGMGVITPKGVLGIVIQTSAHFSNVLTVLHIDSKISAKIKKNGFYGELAWEGYNYRYAQLKDIPNHVKLSKGDTIVTSGLSKVFPEGILIGVVETFDLPEGSNFYNIKVKFSEDYKKVFSAYVIKNKLKMEQDSLELSNPLLND
ncbi:MAG: rod shape-determining protein MreC [Vicingaceae bacterium]